MAINTFRAAVKADPKIKRLKRLLKNGAFSINSEQLISELKSLLATRSDRRLKYKEVVRDQQKQMITAEFDNLSTRSRAAEIQVQCFDISMTLEDHISNLTKHMKSVYASQLKASGYTTVSAQNDAVKNVLGPVYTHLRSLERVIKVCDIIIKDIDQSGFSLQRVKGVLEVSTRKERNL